MLGCVGPCTVSPATASNHLMVQDANVGHQLDGGATVKGGEKMMVKAVSQHHCGHQSDGGQSSGGEGGRRGHEIDEIEGTAPR